MILLKEYHMQLATIINPDPLTIIRSRSNKQFATDKPYVIFFFAINNCVVIKIKLGIWVFRGL